MKKKRRKKEEKIEERTREESEPVGRICGTPSTTSHEVQPVCFDMSELPFVLIVYQICFRDRGTAVTCYESTRSVACIDCAHPARVCEPADLFVHKSSSALYQRCPPRLCDFTNRGILRPQLRRRPFVVHALYTHVYCIPALLADIPPRASSRPVRCIAFFPSAIPRIPARVVSALYFIGILKFKKPHRPPSEIRSAKPEFQPVS